MSGCPGISDMIGPPAEEGSGTANVECGQNQDGSEEYPQEQDGEEDGGGEGEGAG